MYVHRIQPAENENGPTALPLGPIFSASTKTLPLNIVCPVSNLAMVVINMHTNERRVKYK